MVHLMLCQNFSDGSDNALLGVAVAVVLVLVLVFAFTFVDDNVVVASSSSSRLDFRVSYASLMRAKSAFAISRSRGVASGPTDTSGWYLLARCRYARWTSAKSPGGDVRSRPRTACGSLVASVDDDDAGVCGGGGGAWEDAWTDGAVRW